MQRFKLPGLFILLLVVTVLSPLLLEAGQRHKWWQSGEVKTILDLTDDQSEAIEDLYSSTRPVLRSLLTAFETEQQALSKLIVGMAVEDWELTLQIDKVEAARSALSRERTLMLYHMRQQLTGSQQQKLANLEEERRRRWKNRRSTER